jgi:Carboxypeptidase regulatory-like domain
VQIRSFFFCFRHFLLVSAVLSCAAFGADYTGKVLSPDGKPVKGATVYLVELRVGTAISHPTGLNLPTTRTDDDGAFHFPRSPVSQAEFIATADGFGLSSIEPNGIGLIQIPLRMRTDLTVTLLTADNKPAANVGVAIRQIYLPLRLSEGGNNNLWIPDAYNSPWSATTNADGVCSFAGLPQGGRVTLALDDSHFAELSNDDGVQLSGSAQTRAQPIHLQLAASISGRVLYESTTRPAAGVNVQVRANDEVRDVFTGPDGTYSLKRLRPGQCNICVDLNSDMQKSWTAATNVILTVAAGETKTNTDFTLIPGVELSGKVVAADDAKPVAGVPLGIYGPSHPRGGGLAQSVTTDANGSFSVRVPPGAQNVYIMSNTPADGFARPIDDERDITIAAGSTASVEFKLPRVAMSSIKGKVVDPDGNPVANASVYMFSVETPFNYNRAAITTNADGTFQTPPVLRSGRIDLRAKFQDMATPKAVVIYRGGGSDVVVQLEKNGLATITGRVLDQQGKPMKDAQIEILYSIGRGRFGDNAAATDDQGNYKIDSLWADMLYTVEAYHDGYGFMDSNRDLRLSPGQITNIPDLTIFKRDSTVAGVLLDRNDKPVSGQRIYVRGPRTGYSNLTTDSNGKFQCDVVSNDRVTIYYNFNTNRLKQQTAKAGDGNIVLHTAPPIVAPPPPVAPPPVPVVVAAPVAAPAPEAPPPAPTVFDPADAVTWTGWLWAAILVLAGGVVTVIVNAIAAIRGRGQAA